MEAQPYSKEEQRVAEYIAKMTNNGVGGGDDPVQFILASHAHLQHENKKLLQALRDAGVTKLCPWCFGNIGMYEVGSLAYNKHMVAECCIGEID